MFGNYSIIMPTTRGDAGELKSAVCDIVKKSVLDGNFLDLIANKVTDIIMANLKPVLDGIDGDLKELKKQVRDLRREKDDLEQYSRRTSLRIYGVPEENSEDLLTVAVNLFKDKLGVEIDPAYIDRLHRLPKSKRDKFKPVIIKFTSYTWKMKVFSVKKQLKGSGVVIREDLTRERSQLLYRAREAFKDAAVWTSDGRIVIKTENGIYRLRSDDDLQKLKNGDFVQKKLGL